MKILLCKSHLAGPVSGADETLIAYATHLHKGGHRLAVVLLYPPSNADQHYARLKQAGIEVITITSYPLIHIILRNVKTLIFYCSRFLHLHGKPRHYSRQLWQRTLQWVSLIYLKSCRTYFQQCQAALIHVLTPDPGAAVMIRAGFAAHVPVFYQELGTPHYLPELDIHYEWFAKVLPCVQRWQFFRRDSLSSGARNFFPPTIFRYSHCSLKTHTRFVHHGTGYRLT
jgi:hypothetical protein